MATMVSRCPPPPHLVPLARRERQPSHTAELAELAAVLASPAAAATSPVGLDLEQLLEGLAASSGADAPPGQRHSLAAPGPAPAKWSDTELPKTPTSATISMWADAALALGVDAELDAGLEQMQTEHDGGPKLPELPDIDLFDLPGAEMAVDPAAVFAPPTPPMSSPEPEWPGSRSSVELRIVPGRGSGSGSGSSSDSESSGAETCSTHSGHTVASGSRISARTQGTAGGAGKKRAPLRRPANPRPRWKCSAEFLVNKIEPEERTKLARTRPDLYVPNAGDPVTKAQEKALRTALRKIRNVASAQRSRRSQKDYIAALEKRLAETEDENTELSRANSSLSSSLNEALQQLARLRATFANPTGGSAALLMVAACIGMVAPGVGDGDGDDLEDEALEVAPTRFQSRVLLSAAAPPMDTAVGAGWGGMALGVACAAMVVLLAVGVAHRWWVASGLSVGARLEALADRLGNGGTIAQSYPASSNECFDADVDASADADADASGDEAVFAE